MKIRCVQEEQRHTQRAKDALQKSEAAALLGAQGDGVKSASIVIAIETQANASLSFRTQLRLNGTQEDTATRPS